MCLEGDVTAPSLQGHRGEQDGAQACGTISFPGDLLWGEGAEEAKMGPAGVRMEGAACWARPCSVGHVGRVAPEHGLGRLSTVRTQTEPRPSTAVWPWTSLSPCLS